MCSSPSQHQHLQPQRGAELEQEALGWVFNERWAQNMLIWPLSKIWSSSDVSLVQSPVMTAPSLLRSCLVFELPQSLIAKLFPWPWQPSLQCGAVTWGKQCWSICSAQVRARSGVVLGNQSASCVVSICPLHPASGADRCSCVPHKQGTGFPPPSC